MRAALQPSVRRRASPAIVFFVFFFRFFFRLLDLVFPSPLFSAITSRQRRRVMLPVWLEVNKYRGGGVGLRRRNPATASTGNIVCLW